MNFSSRVLLVEDGQINREVGRAMLENFGCRVEIASNGLEAVRLVESDRFDLILMDCQMPEMDGWEAARKIREVEKGGPVTPIIAMTAFMMEAEIKRCRDAGMDDYLGKPFSLRDLCGVLNRWLLPSEVVDTIQGGAGLRAGSDAEQGRVDKAPHSIDLEVLNKTCRMLGSAAPSMMQNIIEIYLADSHRLVQELRRAFESQEPDALGVAAHTLKSSSANLGANVLAGLCGEAERLTRSGSTLGTGVIVGRMEEEFIKVEHALRAYLEKGD